MQAIFVPDLAALRRKLENPPPMLAACYARFQQRLALDDEFRRHHVFLPALLGDPAAVAEVRGQIVNLALNPLILVRERPGEKSPEDSLDNHIWCIAPRAMRLAAYFNWLDIQGAWPPDDRRAIGTGLLDFFDAYVIPVLRARVPGGHNQQLSMTLCSSVVGHVFAEVDGVVRLGASPRAAQALLLAAKVSALAQGRRHVTQQDVVDVAEPVMSHRLLLDHRVFNQQGPHRRVMRALVTHAREHARPRRSRWIGEILRKVSR